MCAELVSAITATIILLVPPISSKADAGNDPIAVAREAIKAGNPEAVLFALDGTDSLPQERFPDAADILAQAAQLALTKEDRLLALQLCQMSLSRVSTQPAALEVCVTAGHMANQFDLAERYVKVLLEKHPKLATSHLLAARLAIAQGEWEKTKTFAKATLGVPALPSEIKAEAQRLIARASKELDERKVALSQSEELARRLDAARSRVARSEANSARVVVTRDGVHAASKVVVYRTEWCGACKRAEAWLRENGIQYDARDVERDVGAADELAAKAAAKKLNLNGVPVIDVAGDLFLGFSAQRVREALVRHGVLSK